MSNKFETSQLRDHRGEDGRGSTTIKARREDLRTSRLLLALFYCDKNSGTEAEFRNTWLNSLLISGPCCREKNVVVKRRVIRRDAEILSKLRAGHQDGLGRRGHPWLGVRLGINNRDLRLDRAVVQAAPSFHDLHLVAVRPAPIGIGFTQPGSFVKTGGLDHKGVSFPTANIPSHPMRFRRVLGKFPSVGPDGPPRVGSFKELEHSVGKHNELKPVVARVRAGPPYRIAINRCAGALHGVFIVKKFSRSVLGAHCCRVLLLSPFCKRRRILEGSCRTGVTPYA